VLSGFLNAKKEVEARACLVALVEVSTEEATFLRPHLDAFAQAMHVIVQTASLDVMLMPDARSLRVCSLLLFCVGSCLFPLIPSSLFPSLDA
jgi:hypothetical protein